MVFNGLPHVSLTTKGRFITFTSILLWSHGGGKGGFVDVQSSDLWSEYIDYRSVGVQKGVNKMKPSLIKTGLRAELTPGLSLSLNMEFTS